jgi:cyclophilin family peptidyl-prolyl cis-trans isomerase
MRFFLVPVLLGLAVADVRGSGEVPTATTPLPDLRFAQGAPATETDLRQHFQVPGVSGPVAQLRSTHGDINLELRPDVAPLTVLNFSNYVASGRYTNALVHRVDKGLGVIQGGGFALPNYAQIPTDPPIPLEYQLPNQRGTIAMARSTAANSATSQWFINTDDNTTSLGQANSGGYAVFGRAIGSSMAVVDAIAALPVYAFASPFNQMPLDGYDGVNVLPANTVHLREARLLPLFPPAEGQPAVVSFTVSNSNPAIVSNRIAGSLLQVIPLAGTNGHADVTVTATDSHGNRAQQTFHVRLAAADGSAGWFTDPAVGQIWDAGGDWFGGSPYGWMWFSPGGPWIWSGTLNGWLARTTPGARTLWSTQFQWLTPAADDRHRAETSSLGTIYIERYGGNPIQPGWVYSPRFGFVWAAGDGIWFYSSTHEWLGVTDTGGIWSVNEGRFL